MIRFLYLLIRYDILLLHIVSCIVIIQLRTSLKTDMWLYGPISNDIDRRHRE